MLDLIRVYFAGGGVETALRNFPVRNNPERNCPETRKNPKH